jgi:hypothetical protein
MWTWKAENADEWSYQAGTFRGKIFEFGICFFFNNTCASRSQARLDSLQPNEPYLYQDLWLKQLALYQSLLYGNPGPRHGYTHDSKWLMSPGHFFITFVLFIEPGQTSYNMCIYGQLSEDLGLVVVGLFLSVCLAMRVNPTSNQEVQYIIGVAWYQISVN